VIYLLLKETNKKDNAVFTVEGVIPPPPSTLHPGMSRAELEVSQKMPAFGPRDAQAAVRCPDRADA